METEVKKIIRNIKLSMLSDRDDMLYNDLKYMFNGLHIYKTKDRYSRHVIKYGKSRDKKYVNYNKIFKRVDFCYYNVFKYLNDRHNLSKEVVRDLCLWYIKDVLSYPIIVEQVQLILPSGNPIPSHYKKQ